MSTFKVGDWVRRKTASRGFPWPLGDKHVKVSEITNYGSLRFDVEGVYLSNGKPFYFNAWDAIKFELVDNQSVTDMEGIEEI